MEIIDLTPLEWAIIACYHERYREWGFPTPSDLDVTKRLHDGSGRYTYFTHTSAVDLKDGPLALGIYSQFEMDCLPYGASFEVKIESNKVQYLDIFPNGDDGWDGHEAAFEILDPGGLDTRLFRQRPH